MKSIFSQTKGHDGQSMDLSGTVTLKKTKVSGQPRYNDAACRCGNCRSITIIQGKPGQHITKFQCRSCREWNQARGEHGGMGFTFHSYS